MAFLPHPRNCWSANPTLNTSRHSSLSKPAIQVKASPAAPQMTQANNKVLDVYCSSQEVLQEMQQRIQTSHLDGMQLQWQPTSSNEECIAGSQPNQEGQDISCPGARPASQSSSFAGQRYIHALNKRGRMGQTLLTANEMTSTQVFLRAHLASLGDGVVLVADKQTAGKGRGGNVWTSPVGCLMFSCSRLLRVLPNQAPFINYVVCLGLVKGIQDAVKQCCGPAAPRLPIAIKWPNDIYYVPPQPGAVAQTSSTGAARGPSGSGPSAESNTVAGQGLGSIVPGDAGAEGEHGGAGVQQQAPQGGRPAVPQKIAGALIHTTWSRDQFSMVTGIGLNLSNPHPTTCLNAILRHSCCPSQAAAPGSAAAAGSAEATDASTSAARDGDASCGSTTEGGGTAAPLHLPQEVVLAHVMNRLDEYFQVFEELGFAPLQADYLAAWMHSGQQVRFMEHEERSLTEPADQSGEQQGQAAGPAEQPLTTLTIQGLSPSGFLLAVEEGSGRQFELTPDGNSLDMMAGLIRRKLPG